MKFWKYSHKIMKGREKIDLNTQIVNCTLINANMHPMQIIIVMCKFY